MLQEIVVPVIKVRYKKKHRQRHRQVGVQVLGQRIRITTPRYRISLLQINPVTETVREVTLKIAVYEDNQPVTDIHTVTFDSTSDNMEERQKSVILTLRDQPYSKHIRYRLVLRNVLTNVTEEHPVIIDRVIIDDF